jgi:hypothetical protein
MPDTLEKEFSDYYSKHILPLNDQLNNKREKVRYNQFRNNLITMLLASMIVVTFFYMISDVRLDGRSSGKIVIAVFTIYITIWYVLVIRSRKKYSTVAKEQLMPLLLKFLGNFNYSVKSSIDSRLVRKHLVFPKHSICYSGDCIYGLCNGDSFKISKVVITSMKGKMLFVGAIILINKKTYSPDRIIIQPYYDSSSLWERLMMKIRDLKTYKVNHEHFDCKFKVYANNESAVRLLLTKDLQNKFLEFNSICDKGGLRYSSMGNSILIAIPSDNLFEPAPLNIPPTDADSVKRMLNDIRFALNIVDTFSS